MTKEMYIVLYVVLMVLSYYAIRYIVRKEFSSWGWYDVIMCAFLSLGTIISVILALLVFESPTMSKKDPPKWL